MGNTHLTSILARWLKGVPDLGADLDCNGCARLMKCCAFQPYIANFYLGAMLEDGKSPFRETDKGVFQPLGLIPSRGIRVRLESMPEETRGPEEACMYYENRSCSIWHHRPAECSFYFCSDDAVAPQRAQWSERGFQRETALAQMALAHLGFGAHEIAAQVDALNTPPEGLTSLPRSEAEDLYRRAWRWAITKSEADVLEWL